MWCNVIYNVIDVSALCNVHDLTLSYCNNIYDVSALNNRILKIINCNQITDVSGLCNVYDLSIYNCDNIGDVSALNNHKLKIVNCNKKMKNRY